ncbi:MAG: hypothetical protein ACT6U0_08400 [Shinella sp.]|uniref:hypothetical protein n=1 Tax=Shinella sp. TaxID=1870904 RepID=UPI0040369A5E
MATLKQTYVILDDVLRLPPASARGHAQRLRTRGLLPAHQGFPSQLHADHVAAILVAIAIGSPAVEDYISMRPGNGGPTFGKVLARFVDRPNDVLDVTLDAHAPGASVTFRGEGGGVETITFYPPETVRRPYFDKEVRFGPEIFIRIASAIASAPEVRSGRPRTRDRYFIRKERNA